MTLPLTRQDFSKIAKSISAQTDLKHTDVLNTIAQSLGFQGSNALMGHLKNQETNREKPISQKDTAGYLYTLTFPFISDEDGLENLSVADIAYEVDAGGAIGAWGEGYTVVKTPLTKEQLGEKATEFGSTPDFFGACDED